MTFVTHGGLEVKTVACTAREPGFKGSLIDKNFIFAVWDSIRLKEEESGAKILSKYF